MRKGLLFMVILLLFLSAKIFASTVIINIIETGIPENRSVSEYTEIWEDAFMDVFFESGLIISNDSILRFETKPLINIFEYVVYDISEISKWGIDFIIITQLDYIGNIRQPSEINFIIYKVRTNEIVMERMIEGKTYRSTREGLDDIKSIVRGLVPYIR
ncbi:MAG: hypothetical protein FWC21_02595 [Treponema sp.]|nr:hypothetical protein [Treponema sp.]